MAITFALCIVIMLIMTATKPLSQAIRFEAKTALELKASRGAKLAGAICILLTLVLYLIFSPLGLAG
jgi:SSS family solute:Na+ symporter